MLFDLLSRLGLPELIKSPKCLNIDDVVCRQIGQSGIYLAHHVFENRGKYGRFYIDGAGVSTSIHDAKFLAIMESIERASVTSIDTVRANVFRSSRPPNVIPIGALAPYRRRKLASIHSGAKNTGYFDYYVSGTGLLTGGQYSVPAFSVFPRWRSYFSDNLVLPESEGSGIASGFCWEKDEIVDRAMLENFERDSALLSWRLPNWRKQEIEGVTLDDQHLGYLTSNQLQLRILNVGQENLPAVIVAILSEKDASHMTVGFSCVKAGVSYYKAINEAIMLRESAIRLFSNQAENILIDPTSSEYHLSFGWENGRMCYSILKPNEKSTTSSNAKVNGLPTLEDKALMEFGFEPIVIDLTHPSLIHQKLFSVFRVIQPFAMKKDYNPDMYYDGGRLIQFSHLGPINTLPHIIA